MVNVPPHPAIIEHSVTSRRIEIAAASWFMAVVLLDGKGGGLLKHRVELRFCEVERGGEGDDGG